MEPGNARIACTCGQVSGYLRARPASYGHRVLCHCKDCQAYLHHLKRADLLDENGGTEIYQTIPARLMINTGKDKIRCVRLSPKGLMRWYAECCVTPLGNTLANPGFGFVGIPSTALPDTPELGRLIASVNGVEAPQGSAPPKDYGFIKAGMRIMLRHLATKTGIAPKGSVFFPDGSPITPAQVLTREERHAATPG